MDTLSKHLKNNREWAKRIEEQNPGFFEELSKGQSPEVLWIGCSDSRVPANQVVDAQPGSLFVHRNVANLVVHSDTNFQSVLQYSVEALKVKHIVVCGHYGCGGVTAALQGVDMGLINHWLSHIQDTIARHKEELEQIGDEQEKINRLCELNVRAQVINIGNSPFVQRAWDLGQSVSIHGWIFQLNSGELKDLELTVSDNNELSNLI